MNETPQDPQHPDRTPGAEPTWASGDQTPAGGSFEAPRPGEPTPGYSTPSSDYPGRYVDPHRSQPDDTTPLGERIPQPSGQPTWQAPHAPQPTQQFGTPATAPVPPWAAQSQHYAPRRRSRGMAAATLVGVLLVGAGAGVGGAALWTSNDSQNSPGGTSVSKVVDNGTPTVLNGSVESVAQKVLPSVVMIEVSGSQGAGSGSGIVLSSDGEILTNNHVVELAESGGSITVVFNDGTRAPASIVGTDPLTDTALIKAENVKDLTPASLGKSSDLKVGQSVVAIGSPFGLNSTVTSGIVSALNRPVNVGTNSGNATVYPAIQTDAAINPGNSGGALVDMNGNVIGINASIRTASDSTAGGAGSIGLGFAIPMDEIVPIIDQMRAGDTPTHARLGIGVADSSENNTTTTLGALVKQVTKGSTAAKAGLQAGDVVTRVDNQLIEGADSLIATIRSHRPGDEVTLTWQHQGKEQSAKLKLDSDNGEYATPQGQQPEQQQTPSDPFGGTNPFGN